MKKTLSLLLTAICALSMTVCAMADATNNEQREIPKAATAPTIDGKMTDDEWANALACKVNKDTTTAVAGTLDTCPDATYYWMWDDTGLYFFGSVKDTTPNGVVHNQGDGSYNSGDGIQFCIYPDITASGSEVGTLYFWSLVVCADGSVGVGEHFTFGTGSAGADVPAAKAVAVKNGDSYDIEAYLPASCWESSTPPIDICEGTTFALANVVMEHDGTNQSLMTDTAWFDGANSNKYTLVSTPAGHVEAPETEAEVVDVVDTTAAETTVEAPKTFDAGIIAAVVAIVSAAGYAISKKH